jgi:FtsZ-binding cell division protein ZapB
MLLKRSTICNTIDASCKVMVVQDLAEVLTGQAEMAERMQQLEFHNDELSRENEELREVCGGDACITPTFAFALHLEMTRFLLQAVDMQALAAQGGGGEAGDAAAALINSLQKECTRLKQDREKVKAENARLKREVQGWQAEVTEVKDAALREVERVMAVSYVQLRNACF